MPLMTDVEILTEHASQIAHRKEDRTAASPSSQTVLLTHVRKVAAHQRVAPSLAGAGLIFQPVGIAVTRAGLTLGQALNGASRASREFSGRMQVQVGGAEGIPGNCKAITGRFTGHGRTHD